MTTWTRPDTVHATLRFLLKLLAASGAEFLGARDDTSFRVGAPRWLEPATARQRRSKEEMRLFRRLDSAYARWVRAGDTPTSTLGSSASTR
jgi:hypothetical protein